MRIVLHATRKGRQVVNIAFVVAVRGAAVRTIYAPPTATGSGQRAVAAVMVFVVACRPPVSSINNEFMNLWFHEFMNFIRREAPIEFFG
jgi:hypothetical protein